MAVRYEINTTPDDGEVLLSETMSADWSALQVQIVPLNSSGGYEPLTSGSVSVMVSPFSSGDFWIDVNNNNYYGVALRLKVIKSQIPAGIASLKVLVWRSATSVPSSQVVAQSYAEFANKQGKLFTASRRVTDVAGGASLDSIFITGSKQVVFNQRIIGYTGKGVVASIYRGAVATGDTAAEINNPNDITPQAATAQLLTGSTITSIGQLTIPIWRDKRKAPLRGFGLLSGN